MILREGHKEQFFIPEPYKREKIGLEEGRNKLLLNLETQQLSVPLTVGHSSRIGRRHVHRHMGCRTKPFLVRTHLSCQPGSWCTQPPLCGARWHSWSHRGTGRAGSPRPCLLLHPRNTHRCTSRNEIPLCYPYSRTHLDQRTHFFILHPTQEGEQPPGCSLSHHTFLPVSGSHVSLCPLQVQGTQAL